MAGLRPEMDDKTHRFGGIARLVTTRGLDVLEQSHVCVIGIGGVGSWTVEALARSGVGQLTLVDLDDVCVSNVNRQIHALDSTVGQAKIDVMAERVRLINPLCRVNVLPHFFTPKTADNILETPYDYVIDGIDGAIQKCRLIAACRERNLNVLTVGGAGGRLDADQVVASDLNETYNDSLLYRVRKMLRQEFGLPRGKKPWGIPAVYSREKPMYPTLDGGICETPTPQTSLKMNCASGYGAATFVTGTFGFVAASVVVKELTENGRNQSE